MQNRSRNEKRQPQGLALLTDWWGVTAVQECESRLFILTSMLKSFERCSGELHPRQKKMG
jgi:hypothetical protein